MTSSLYKQNMPPFIQFICIKKKVLGSTTIQNIYLFQPRAFPNDNDPQRSFPPVGQARYPVLSPMPPFIQFICIKKKVLGSTTIQNIYLFQPRAFPNDNDPQRSFPPVGQARYPVLSPIHPVYTSYLQTLDLRIPSHELDHRSILNPLESPS
ncbi:hypothetical protein GOP47_0028848 [Adiantum capillus-veneris]|nr:hypothetical protein GOP47_0028848 [Adiantum capillus-veneris]